MMLKLPMIFGDRMVLQRRKPIAFWGIAAPGQEVTVSLRSNTQMLCAETAVADENGNWSMRVPALEAQRDVTVSVMSDGEQFTFSDVMIGEVWIAGGQSNMEYHLHFDEDKQSALELPENPDIRFFDYPEVSFEGALEQYDFDQAGFWRRCREEDLPWFSAVGYYFAVKVQSELGIPVGIVGCNWGGTRACSWMSEEALQTPWGRVWTEEYHKNLEGVDLAQYSGWYRNTPANIPNHPIPGAFPQIMYPGLSREQQLGMMEQMAQYAQHPFANLIGPDHPWRPSGLYHTMLEKIVPYTVQGVLWYQGESDVDHPHLYRQMMGSLMENWRQLWQEELPFLMVQLAPFGTWLQNEGTDYPILRRCQQEVCDEIAGAYLCSSSDSGMQWDIHPKRKQPIGHRLALLALGKIYGREILCEAPRLDAVTLEGDEAVVTFLHAQGLHLKGEETVRELTVNGAPAQGRLCGNTVRIKLPEGNRWDIAFAGTGYYEVNLYNEAGIPAVPFTAHLER